MTDKEEGERIIKTVVPMLDDISDLTVIRSTLIALYLARIAHRLPKHLQHQELKHFVELLLFVYA